jgi:hypothetical protein
MGQTAQRAALGRARRVAHGEGADGEFVDEAGRARRGTRDPGQRLDDGLRDERRRLDAGGAQLRRMNEGAIEPRRIGVQQQLRRIEPMAGARIARAVGAQAVARAGTNAGDENAPDRRSARRSRAAPSARPARRTGRAIRRRFGATRGREPARGAAPPAVLLVAHVPSPSRPTTMAQTCGTRQHRHIRGCVRSMSARRVEHGHAPPGARVDASKSGVGVTTRSDRWWRKACRQPAIAAAVVGRKDARSSAPPPRRPSGRR